MSPDGKTMVVGTGIDGRDTLSLVEVATGKERPLALPPGVNTEAPSGNGVFGTRGFAPDNRHFLYYHASADTPGELYVADTNSGTSRALTRLSMASLDSARLPKSTIVTFRSFDGTAISAIVTVPFNLQRDGTNPAVVIPHGGPTSQSKDYFSKTATALASRGYLVIQPNFRGSTGYGKAFQIANMKDLGGGDLRDVIAAKDFLVASGYVDSRKVGITGGSYGGFMTLMALGKAPEAFAAGAQWFGIINWHTMWTAGDASLREYQRTLVGDPEKDAALYAAQSPMTYLSQAKAPPAVPPGRKRHPRTPRTGPGSGGPAQVERRRHGDNFLPRGRARLLQAREPDRLTGANSGLVRPSLERAEKLSAFRHIVLRSWRHGGARRRGGFAWTESLNLRPCVRRYHF